MRTNEKKSDAFLNCNQDCFKPKLFNATYLESTIDKHVARQLNTTSIFFSRWHEQIKNLSLTPEASREKNPRLKMNVTTHLKEHNRKLKNQDEMKFGKKRLSLQRSSKIEKPKFTALSLPLIALCNHLESILVRSLFHMTRFSILIILFLTSNSISGQIDQFIHLDLINDDVDKRVDIVGTSSVNSTQNSFLSHGYVESDNDDWLRVLEADVNDLYVLEFQVEDLDNGDISVSIAEVGAAPKDGFTLLDHQVSVIHNEETIFQFPHQVDRIYKVVQCDGRIAYYADNILIVSKMSSFMNSIESVVTCRKATGEDLFLHFFIANDCVPPDDIVFHVPKRKTSGQYSYVEGDRMGISYIEKYAISPNDPLYKNDIVSISIEYVGHISPPPPLVQTFDNVYGLNKHVVDVSSLTDGFQYLATISGINKEETYYLPFIKK